MVFNGTAIGGIDIRELGDNRLRIAIIVINPILNDFRDS
jgi:hypothetical protein